MMTLIITDQTAIWRWEYIHVRPRVEQPNPKAAATSEPPNNANSVPFVDSETAARWDAY